MDKHLNKEGFVKPCRQQKQPNALPSVKLFIGWTCGQVYLMRQKGHIGCL
jgi:hypothetical protein